MAKRLIQLERTNHDINRDIRVTPSNLTSRIRSYQGNEKGGFYSSTKTHKNAKNVKNEKG